MLRVTWITLDVAEWMILQFFYTIVMLCVGRITLDDAEWMILQFLHYRDVAHHADHSGRRRMDDFTIFLHYRDVVRRAAHSGRRTMDGFTIFFLE